MILLFIYSVQFGKPFGECASTFELSAKGERETFIFNSFTWNYVDFRHEARGDQRLPSLLLNDPMGKGRICSVVQNEIRSGSKKSKTFTTWIF